MPNYHTILYFSSSKKQEKKLGTSDNTDLFQITRWFVDRGINYKTELDKRDSTLDVILWQCAENDNAIQNSELLMKECVLLNLYNQLQSALTTSDSYPRVSAECVNERNAVAHCIKRSAKTSVTNGEAVRYLLSALSK